MSWVIIYREKTGALALVKHNNRVLEWKTESLSDSWAEKQPDLQNELDYHILEIDLLS